MKHAICVAVVVTAFCAPLSQAAMILGDAVLLSELVDNNESIVVGDKEFNDFSYASTNEMPEASGVNVIPIKDDAGNFGIRFQGAFIDTSSSQGGSDALINYKVTVLDPAFLIVDAHIEGNTNILGDTGSISVTETFLPLGANGEFNLEILDDANNGQTQLVDWVDFDQGYRSLSVQKDILALAQPNGLDVTLSFVDQTFSQTLIPEPAGIVLLGGMLSMMAVVRYRLG
ncbi:MAG: hypothetical protein ACR2NU_15255 [Aeoliella sp.]